jgi:hypothetical protein
MMPAAAERLVRSTATKSRRVESVPCHGFGAEFVPCVVTFAGP